MSEFALILYMVNTCWKPGLPVFMCKEKLSILDFPLLRFCLIFKMAYFLSWPVQELFKKARVRCAIANSKIFAKTSNIFIRGRYLYQWYHYNHNAKRYENVIRGIINYECAYEISFFANSICICGVSLKYFLLCSQHKATLSGKGLYKDHVCTRINICLTRKRYCGKITIKEVRIDFSI
jgi:hypothetical protein